MVYVKSTLVRVFVFTAIVIAVPLTWHYYASRADNDI